MGKLLSRRGGLILASVSPRRRLLLKRLRVPFRVVPARVSEDSAQRRPDRLVAHLALRKARAVARRHPGALVLGADTIVVHRGDILGKPESVEHSRRMLGRLNGRWHRVYTGVALVSGDRRKSWREVVVSRVKTRELDDKTLRRYAGRHLDKAGAYAAQDEREPFVERVVGPLDNVIGLPLDAVRRLLRRASRELKG